MTHKEKEFDVRASGPMISLGSHTHWSGGVFRVLLLPYMNHLFSFLIWDHLVKCLLLWRKQKEISYPTLKTMWTKFTCNCPLWINVIHKVTALRHFQNMNVDRAHDLHAAHFIKPTSNKYVNKTGGISSKTLMKRNETLMGLSYVPHHHQVWTK